MSHNTEHDNATMWNNAGDYANTKQKAGRDKRLNNKSERKALKQYRDARKNRHAF